MHPLIRLLSLLVLAACLPWLPDGALLATGLALLTWALMHAAAAAAMRRGIRRIRWLLLSLAILYLWFSPGTPLLPALEAVSPTSTGAALALRHGGVLLVMVCAATALLGGLSAHELAAALRGLLVGPLRAPLTMRFAERVGLLLAELPQVERHLGASLTRRETGIAERAASLLRAVEREAATSTEPPESLTPAPVPRIQWLLPAALLVAGLLCVFLPEGF